MNFLVLHHQKLNGNYISINNTYMRTREQIYSEVIQEYSYLKYYLEGNELKDKINKIVDNVINYK